MYDTTLLHHKHGGIKNISEISIKENMTVRIQYNSSVTNQEQIEVSVMNNNSATSTGSYQQPNVKQLHNKNKGFCGPKISYIR